eukprot:11125968-Heterocapsa_arctica.AAC.1
MKRGCHRGVHYWWQVPGIGDTSEPSVQIAPEMLGGRGGSYGGSISGGTRSVRMVDVLELVLE